MPRPVAMRMRTIGWRGWAGTLIAALVGLVLLLFLALAVMPASLFEPFVRAQLSAGAGRPVTIGSIERLDRFSLSPELRLRDLTVPQPGWAGSAPLARIASATVRFPLLPLLVGRFEPSRIELSGARIALMRNAQGRKNWAKGDGKGDEGGGPSLGHVVISDMRVSYRDALRDRAFLLSVSSDQTGLRANGRGTVLGQPVSIAASGPAIDGAAGHWPFRATLDGPALAMTVTGTMDRPLDTHHMSIDLTTRASDLHLVDAVIEAGLFGTQPVNLAAHARRDGSDWRIERLHGTIGRSDIAGALTVTKRNGRTHLDGSLSSKAMDFDDLSSNEGRARAAAQTRAEGERLVPNTRVNLGHMTHTDGVLRVRVAHVLSRTGRSSIASVSAVLTLDHQRLTVAPLRIGLVRGTLTGSVIADQHEGGAVPRVALDLSMADSSVTALTGGDGGKVEAPLAGRLRLAGYGSTIREAVGRSSGSIGLAAGDGVLPARLAALMGFDVVRGLTEGHDDQARLRCAVARFVVRDGLATADPIVIDTSLSQAHGTGTIRFPTEALALGFTGAPKPKTLLRLPGSVTLGGSIRAPDLVIPRNVKSVGNVLKGLFRTITGDQGPRATDADCATLVRTALR